MTSDELRQYKETARQHYQHRNASNMPSEDAENSPSPDGECTDTTATEQAAKRIADDEAKERRRLYQQRYRAEHPDYMREYRRRQREAQKQRKQQKQLEHSKAEETRKATTVTEPVPEDRRLIVVLAENAYRIDSNLRVVIQKYPLCNLYSVSVLHNGKFTVDYYRTKKAAFSSVKIRLKTYADISEIALADYQEGGV